MAKIQDTNCCLCGNAGGTREHFPTKALLKKPYPSDLWTVPTCEACQNNELDNTLLVFLQLTLSKENTSVVDLKDRAIRAAIRKESNQVYKMAYRQLLLIGKVKNSTEGKDHLNITLQWPEKRLKIQKIMDELIEKWCRCAAHYLYGWDVCQSNCCVGSFNGFTQGPDFSTVEEKSFGSNSEIILRWFKDTNGQGAFFSWAIHDQVFATGFVASSSESFNKVKQMRSGRAEAYASIEEEQEFVRDRLNQRRAEVEQLLNDIECKLDTAAAEYERLKSTLDIDSTLTSEEIKNRKHQLFDLNRRLNVKRDRIKQKRITLLEGIFSDDLN
jgi:hypothetical protein